MTAMVFIPGWPDSGPALWQALWAKGYPYCARVEQRDERHPDRGAWVMRLDEVLSGLDEPAVLVAHDLGVSTAVHWVAQASLRAQQRVKGALLVAPLDVRDARLLSAAPAHGFAPEPDWALPFPSILVAGTDDPWCPLEHAEFLARAWGSQWMPQAHAGHLNDEHRLGPWEMGQKLLQRLMLA